MDNTRGREEWAPFLERWSGEWVDGHDPESDAPLAEEVAKDRWLGFAPAAEADIAAAEARLGRRLPPSLPRTSAAPCIHGVPGGSSGGSTRCSVKRQRAPDASLTARSARASPITRAARTTDHIAPVSLLAHPALADLLTPERGRELLAAPRGE